MTYVIVQNTREGDTPPGPERRDDGGFYPYGLYFDGDRTIAWVDDFDDMVEVLSPGYADEDDHNQLITRITLAIKAQTAVQATVYADASPDDAAALTTEERTLLDGTHHGRPHIDEWTSEIPLVLVTTAYKPHTETPQPVSSYGPYKEVPNLWWIDPWTAESLLTDLHAIGFVRVVQTISPEDGYVDG